MEELDILALAERFGIHPVMLFIPIIVIEFLKKQWSWLRDQIADRYTMVLCQGLVWGQGLIEYAPPLLADMAMWSAGGFILWLTTAKGLYKHVLKRFGLAGESDGGKPEPAAGRSRTDDMDVPATEPAARADADSGGGARGSGGSGSRFGYQSDN